MIPCSDRRPSRASGSSRIAAIAGGVSTWLQNTAKLASPSRRAWSRTTAVGGVVVSKPTAMNTTFRLGRVRASFSASAGE
jgi:hypothetical protein